MTEKKLPKQVYLLKLSRKIHRITGLALLVFFFLMSVTGVLLAWKKNSGGALLAKSYKGTSTDFKDWLPMDSLYKAACRFMQDSVSPERSLELNKVDVRKNKGMIKFIFEGYWGVQVDGATGKLLYIERRRADFIENLHDGSFLDSYFGIKGGYFKLLYSSIMGLALIVFGLTGFWLWYGPKQIKKYKTRLKRKKRTLHMCFY